MTESFPSRELLEVIKSQARMEEKLDAFLETHSGLKSTVDKLDVRVTETVVKLDTRVKALEDKSLRGTAYVAGAGSVAGVGMSFLIPYVKSKLGL